MNHWFITTDGSLQGRWMKAFHDAAALMPADAEQTVAAGDLAWLSTGVDQWLDFVPVLAGQGAHVVVLSYASDEREALSALDSGARGYVHTLAAPDLLKQVALVVSNHGVWVGQELLARVLGGSLKALQARAPSDQTINSALLECLTERERSVALSVSRGATNKEIARQLDISERTVKAHLSAIFRKLCVRDRLQLILKLAPSREHLSERI
ncbi:response regulator transcription factor [Kushneria aurantia]|uniref:LuxR C-terminal-related transcriptional regulator n=1 Tax=Kushneria aurantia TaxID=504092 RepID=A0ABV6G6W4_9GAMM|nr:response regulator transcription factor [Kushneria aurantia]